MLVSIQSLSGCSLGTTSEAPTPYNALYAISPESSVEICTINFKDERAAASSPEKLQRYLDSEGADWFSGEISYEAESGDQVSQIISACSLLMRNQPESKARIELKRQGKNYADELKEMKFQIDKWNVIALKEGSGNIYDYFTAIENCEYSTVGVSQRQDTGVDLTAQKTTCMTTSRSSWKNGNPYGWWRVDFDFVGSDTEPYSVEFTKNKWASSGDTSLAGLLLNWNIPQDVSYWIKNYPRVES